MKKSITCIICPKGCPMVAEMGADGLNVSGYTCPRGLKYATDEYTNPTRTVTSSVRIANLADTMVSVKTASPIPKENIFDLMQIIHNTTVNAPVKIGQVIIENIYGTDIIATKTVEV